MCTKSFCVLLAAFLPAMPALALDPTTPALESGSAATGPTGRQPPVLLLPAGGEEFRRALLGWSARPASVPPTGDPAEILEMPVARTRLSSSFGYRHDPLGRGLRAHQGIDIPDAMSAPVHAAAGGLVVFAGRGGGYGNLVQIDHGGGSETRYGHLSAITVGVGDRVAQGDVVGLIGSTGRSTGPHLHFEVRQDGRALDPLSRLGEAVTGMTAEPPPSVPVREQWRGYREDRTSLPESQLR